MILADMEAIWAVLIVNVFAFLALALKMWRDEVIARAALDRIEVARVRGETHAKELSDKLEASRLRDEQAAKDLLTLKQQTNGLTKALVKSEKTVSFAAGVASEQAKTNGGQSSAGPPHS